VAKALRVDAPRIVESFTRVSTDTRAIKAGELFVALTGERYDGHAFLESALKAGATGAVVRKGTRAVPGLAFFPVDDTLVALGWLARARRDAISGPVVAITGSNGKTSTKEMTAQVLRTKWRTHRTEANLNNLIGVPLTILSAPDDTEALVIEAGASVRGEIARSREIIAPTVAVVTNVSAAHVEGFGSVSGVLAEKVTLLKHVPLAIVGLEPPALAERARKAADKVLVAGLTGPADVRPERWSLDDQARATIRFRGRDVHVPLPGRHQADNAMIALAVAESLGVDLVAAGAALGDVQVPSGRSEVIRSGGLTILNDAYNANPASLAAALDTARAMRASGRRLVLVVGSMLELGQDSAARHAEAAEWVVAQQPDLIGAVGEFVAPLERHHELKDRLVTAKDADELGAKLKARLWGDELVVLKASRGMRLERVLPHLLPT
jgi:UDP-N-acetylmuramoyl-tripeptide--D-alanyl-D-alanine ligase